MNQFGRNIQTCRCDTPIKINPVPPLCITQQSRATEYINVFPELIRADIKNIALNEIGKEQPRNYYIKINRRKCCDN